MVYCIEPKGEFRKFLMYTLESCGYPIRERTAGSFRTPPSGTDPSGL